MKIEIINIDKFNNYLNLFCYKGSGYWCDKNGANIPNEMVELSGEVLNTVLLYESSVRFKYKTSHDDTHNCDTSWEWPEWAIERVIDE